MSRQEKLRTTEDMIMEGDAQFLYNWYINSPERFGFFHRCIDRKRILYYTMRLEFLLEQFSDNVIKIDDVEEKKKYLDTVLKYYNEQKPETQHLYEKYLDILLFSDDSLFLGKNKEYADKILDDRMNINFLKTLILDFNNDTFIDRSITTAEILRNAIIVFDKLGKKLDIRTITELVDILLDCKRTYVYSIFFKVYADKNIRNIYSKEELYTLYTSFLERFRDNVVYIFEQRMGKFVGGNIKIIRDVFSGTDYQQEWEKIMEEGNYQEIDIKKKKKRKLFY